MDKHLNDSDRRSPSRTTIDIYADEWDDQEDVELGGDEHELFLRDDYVTPSNRDIQPFRAPSPALRTAASPSKAQSPNGVFSSNRSHSIPIPQTANDTAINKSNNHRETFNIQDSRPSSPCSSVVYQLPNYQQFAGSLAPSGPTSVIISFVIIVVILCVTILPIVLPQSSDDDSSFGYDNDISGGGGSYSTPVIAAEHADARCKCICPPLRLPATTSKPKSTPKPANTTIHDGASIHSSNHTSNTTVSKAPANKTSSSSSTSTTTTSTTVASVIENSSQRRLYVGKTPSSQCNCNNIVHPHLNNLNISLKDFCSRCECRFQSRNTATIRRNVIFFIIILIGLGLYMFVQYILKYLHITRRHLPRRMRWLSHQLIEMD